jgi:hypothetical protein
MCFLVVICVDEYVMISYNCFQCCFSLHKTAFLEIIVLNKKACIFQFNF